MVRAPRPDRFAISSPSSTKARPEVDFWSSARSVPAATPATPRALTRIRLRSPPSLPKTQPQARRDGRDEPFAFASREFLRRLLIGKQVKFRVEYAVQSIGREFGQVYVGDVNAAVESVANGWAKVRVGGGDQASNHEDLVAAESAAQAAAIGVWTKDPTQLATAVRIVPHAFDPNSLLPTMKGRPVPCVVEAVLNGAALRVQLMTDGTETRHATCVVFLAGVQAPAMKSSRKNHHSDDAGAGGDATSAATDASNGAADAKPEPFAREAKHFTEVRLLNRDVHIVPEGTDKYDNLFLHGAIRDGADLAEALAGNGLARCVDWSLSMITAGASKLRAAEKAAKAHRRCVWRDYVAPPPNPNSSSVKISSASSSRRRLGIPSSRRRRRDWGGATGDAVLDLGAPKLGNERRGIKPEPWAHEAKEFLRGGASGKSVKVSMEYVRKIPTANGGTAGGAGAEASGITLEMGTVMLPTDQLKGEDGSAATNDTGVAELNVAEMLVLRGLATVVRHRNDDDERSLRYDDLVQAEQRAIKGKKGVQNKDKPAPVHHVNDVSANAQKSRQILPFLQRAGRSHAIVDYVLSGHRLKLSVPKEGAIVAFAIAGVRCPRGDEPGAAEAYRFVRRELCQRDCEIEVEAVDKVGTFLGTLTYGKGNAKAPTVLNLGVELLRRGLGTLHDSYDPRGRANGEALFLPKTLRRALESAFGSTGPRRRRLRTRRPRRLPRAGVPRGVPRVPRCRRSRTIGSRRALRVGRHRGRRRGRFFCQRATGATARRGSTRSCRRSRRTCRAWDSNPGRELWSPGASPATTSGTAPSWYRSKASGERRTKRTRCTTETLATASVYPANASRRSPPSSRQRPRSRTSASSRTSQSPEGNDRGTPRLCSRR